MGSLTCLGDNVSDLWENLKNGVSGIRRITQVDPDSFPCKVSGEVQNFDPSDWMDKKESKRMGRFSQLAVAAAKEAIEQSGFLGKVKP